MAPRPFSCVHIRTGLFNNDAEDEGDARSTDHDAATGPIFESSPVHQSAVSPRSWLPT